jgi:hypothetical protein
LVPIHQETGKVLGKVRQVLTTDGSVQVLAERRSFDTEKYHSCIIVSEFTLQKRHAHATNSRQEAQRLRTFCEFGDSLVPMSVAD